METPKGNPFYVGPMCFLVNHGGVRDRQVWEPSPPGRNIRAERFRAEDGLDFEGLVPQGSSPEDYDGSMGYDHTHCILEDTDSRKRLLSFKETLCRT